MSTGLASANELTLDLLVDDVAWETLDLDVFVNATNVGSFSLNPIDIGLQQFKFSFAPILGDSYFIQMIATNTLTPLVGSYSISLEGGFSTATLFIPEPSALILIVGLMGARRRRG